MAKILLLRGPLVFAKDSVSSPVSMPLSIAYLAASLLAAGHEVEVLDALGLGLDKMRTSYRPGIVYRGLSNDEIIARMHGDYDAIGITTMFSQEWPHLRKLVDDVHRAFPDLPIIMGGEHANACAELVLRQCPGVQHVCLGEGEATILEYAEFLDGRRALDDVAGLVYRGNDGAVRKTTTRARISRIDELPWPAWHLFDLEPYFATGESMGVARGRSMPILATRGCPYQCTFCSNPSMWTQRYVLRDVDDLLDEIQHYLEVYRATNIDFYDLTAIVKPSWTKELCRRIQERGLHFTWQLPSGTRSEALSEEVLGLMAKTGCMNVTYAPESGSERTLREIKKQVNLDHMLESIRAAKRQGIIVKCNLVIGFPKETRSDVLQTFGLALRFAQLAVDDVGIYVFSPYPGSALYRYLRERGVIGDDEKYFESLLSFMKLIPEHTFCENLGRHELVAYRVAGMALFYGASYLFHPERIVRTIKNAAAGRADSTIEQRVTERLRRIRRLWRDDDNDAPRVAPVVVPVAPAGQKAHRTPIAKPKRARDVLRILAN